jgi:hypothetical protein
MPTIAALIGEELATYDDVRVEEEVEPTLLIGEPESLKQCNAWIEECRSAIEATERKILHLRGGHRPLKEDGRSLTEAEMTELKEYLYKRKGRFQNRYRWLKEWRRTREEVAATTLDAEPDPLTVGVRCMKAAAKRYIHLEELYSAVAALIEVPEGAESEDDWDPIYAALDALNASAVIHVR